MVSQHLLTVSCTSGFRSVVAGMSVRRAALLGNLIFLLTSCLDERSRPVPESVAPPVITTSKSSLIPPDMASSGGSTGACAAPVCRQYDAGNAGSSVDAATACNPKVVPVQEQHQAQPLWCWAAAAQMLMGSVGSGCTVSQCQLATDDPRNAGQNCCQDGGACSNGNWPDFVSYGFSVTIRQGSWPDWPTLMAELDANRPMGFVVASRPQPSDGHMKIVIGYAKCALGHTVETFDPNDGLYEWREYDGFSSGNADQVILRTYYKIQQSDEPRCFEEHQASDRDAHPCFDSGKRKSSSYPLALSRTAADLKEPVPQMAANDLEAAKKGLLLVRAMGRKHPSSLGFDNPEEAANAELDPDDVANNGYALEVLHESAANRMLITPDGKRYHFGSGAKHSGIMRVEKRPNSNFWWAMQFTRNTDSSASLLREAMRQAAAQGQVVRSIVYVPATKQYLLKNSKGELAPLQQVDHIERGQFVDPRTMGGAIHRRYPERL
jgi:hypothetical protein